MVYKVGDLAKKTGLTVRALHHYDSIGLLSPSLRSDKGVRLYGQADLIRLHRIQAMKHLGYGLPDIRQSLDDPDIKPQQIIHRQIEALREESRRARELSERLEYINAHLREGLETAASDWLNLLEMMMFYKSNLSEAEMTALRNPKGARVAELSRQWTQLVTEVDQAIAARVPVHGDEAQALSWRWIKLVIAMTSNDALLAGKLKALQEREARAQEILGIDPAKFAWIGEAFAHARTRLFAKYLTPAQSAEILRRQLAAPELIDAWPHLIARVRAQMEQGARAEDEAVQALMREWRQLFRDSYCGEDAEMEGRVRVAFISEPDLMLGVGVDEALMVFVQKAMMHFQRPPEVSRDAGPKPSAHMVALQRAAHQLLDRPLVLNDPLALPILGPEDQAALKSGLARFHDPMSRGLRASLVVRSRMAEDQWQTCLAQGFRQCVILGAGLDTFAYRHNSASGKGNETVFFEVDLPATQQWKRERVSAAGISVPPNLRYVPVNFETGSLARALADAGFDAAQPALFIWLGVVMYLDDTAIEGTLGFIASCAAGTQVVFDFVVPSSTLPAVMRVPIDMMAKYLADTGEPWKSYFEPRALAEKMTRLGFATAVNADVRELNERYLAARDDGMQLNGLTRLMLATV